MRLVDFVEDKYKNWIDLNYPTPESAQRKCLEATEGMVTAFPELKRVRGLAYVKEPFDLPPTKTPHWWCLAEDGTIVDPTHHQYPTYIIDYDPVDESRGEPTGKCPNCGDLAYAGSNFCTPKCGKEYMAYLNNPEPY